MFYRHVISWATFFPAIGAGLIVLLVAARYLFRLPKKLLDDSARFLALATSGLSLVAAIAAWRWYDPHAAGLAVAGRATGVQLAEHAVWIRAFNVEYFVGVDGLS